MSNRHNVTLYRNGVTTKDGKREVLRAQSWQAYTQADGVVTFKLKFSAALAVPVGFVDSFKWERVENEETGEVRGLKAKASVYGLLNPDKSGSLWLNPFTAKQDATGKWIRCDRNDPDGKPMVFELAKWGEEQKKEEVPVAREDALDKDIPF